MSQTAVERRKKALAEEVRALDRLVPRAKREMIISGERTVVDDSDELGHWNDLDDPDAREMGGDGRTKAAQHRTERPQFERSLNVLRDAADLLK